MSWEVLNRKVNAGSGLVFAISNLCVTASFDYTVNILSNYM